MPGQLLRRDPVVQAHPSTLNFYGESNYSRLFKEMNVSQCTMGCNIVRVAIGTGSLQLLLTRYCGEDARCCVAFTAAVLLAFRAYSSHGCKGQPLIKVQCAVIAEGFICSLQAFQHPDWRAVQPELKAKLSDTRYNISMENHEFGVAPEAFTKWIVLNETYDILSTSFDR